MSNFKIYLQSIQLLWIEQFDKIKVKKCLLIIKKLLKIIFLVFFFFLSILYCIINIKCFVNSYFISFIKMY